MLNQFKKYYKDNSLFKLEDKMLLTVSGGMDSVAMVYLFQYSGLNFGIAHCNFKLRGEEADKDEQFVSKLASKYKIPFHTVSFDTEKYARENGMSIQMAARELRYNWFEKVREQESYSYIATAHHKNDVAETILINLTNGTGISGLHGILSKKDKIVRPLLGFTRQEILDFVEENKINYREDLSNSDVKYTRNKIRHQVIPHLEKINPNVIETLYTESKQFLGLEQILNQKIKEEKEKCFVKEGGLVKIEIEKLLKLSPLKAYLYFFLKEYGFNASIISSIIDSLKRQSGKTFYSSDYLLLKDRAFLILKTIHKNKEQNVEITSIKEFDQSPISLLVNLIEIDDEFKLEKSNDIALLNFERIQFPLKIRKWKEGDVFQPIGLQGNKKLSDFFIDEKLSLIEKKSVWILESQGQIVWVIGYRIADYFKIRKSTKHVLSLKKV